MKDNRKRWLGGMALVLLAALGAAFLATGATASQKGADADTQLAAVRTAISGFDTTAKAQAAGWNLQPGLSQCFDNPGVGAMGFHYINPALLDTTFDLLKPEAIVYEPLPGGLLKLAAVEYIVPAAPWDAEGHAGPPTAPALGQTFHLNQALGVYVLHAWTFKNNPSGIFQDWNPDVSCATAGDVQLAAVRTAISGFDTTAKAQAAGWNLQPGLSQCFDNPGVGAMGFHYINPALLDTTFDLLKPEAIVYEPLPGGLLKLAAVEYIVPAAPWDAEGHAGPPTAPALGQTFHLNQALGVYVLHAWTFKNNPSGIFQDWNPDVLCPVAPNPPNTGTGPPRS